MQLISQAFGWLRALIALPIIAIMHGLTVSTYHTLGDDRLSWFISSTFFLAWLDLPVYVLVGLVGAGLTRISSPSMLVRWTMALVGGPVVVLIILASGLWQYREFAWSQPETYVALILSIGYFFVVLLPWRKEGLASETAVV